MLCTPPPSGVEAVMYIAPLRGPNPKWGKGVTPPKKALLGNSPKKKLFGNTREANPKGKRYTPRKNRQPKVMKGRYTN